MNKSEKALKNLRLTGWRSSQVAEKLNVSPRVARMYLNGERKIPARLWDKIPVTAYSGDTHLKSRSKKEERKNQLRKYSLKVPGRLPANELFPVLINWCHGIGLQPPGYRAKTF